MEEFLEHLREQNDRVRSRKTRVACHVLIIIGNSGMKGGAIEQNIEDMNPKCRPLWPWHTRNQ